MVSGEAANTNFIAIGLTPPSFEITTYHIQDEHANHYTTDAVLVKNRR